MRRLLKRFRKDYQTLNTVRVSKSALLHNLEHYRKKLPGQAICPVLKSNAYGHGLELVAQAWDRKNCPFFVVDSLYEAYKLEAARIKTPILILGYTKPENLEGRRFKFHFTASDLEGARHLAKLGVPVHLELDTGFNRMGFSLEQLKEQLDELKRLKLKVVGVFTHFADADNPSDASFTKAQKDRFKEGVRLIQDAGFKPKWIHTGGSGSNLKVEFPLINMRRIGIELYGHSPYDDAGKQLIQELKPALEFSSSIIALRDLKKGDKVGYGCTFEAHKDMKIAVLAAGYYEGLPRSLSNQSEFVGRICMNHCMIDASTLKQPKLGDPYVLYSRDPNSPKHVYARAKAAQCLNYELLVRLSESVRRELVG